MREASGDLDLFGVAGLLQLLSQSDVRGMLTVWRGDARKTVEFTDRGIRLSGGVRRTNPLGEILVRSGLISAAQLEDLLAEQKRAGRRLGDLVAQHGFLPQETIDSALREQAAEEVYELFSWTGAKFSFVEATPGLSTPGGEGPLSEVFLDANVMSIMLEAARRMDELTRIREIIPDDRLVPIQLEVPVGLDDPGLDPKVALEVFPLLDGRRSIEEISEMSLYPRFTVLRALYGLVQRGSVKIQSHREKAEAPITVLRRPVKLDPGNPAGGRTILLLSELESFRGALAFCLRMAGFSVLEGARWDGAAQTLCRDCVHAVVLDVSIETDDGLSLCQGLKGTTGVPFILLSQNASRKAVANAIRSGASSVLVKPIKEELLVERLTDLFRVGPASAPAPVPEMDFPGLG